MVTAPQNNFVSDASTFELSQSCPSLKKGIQFRVQYGRNETWLLIVDPTKSSYFRIGTPVYTLITNLDGSTTISEAVSRTCLTLGPDAISEQEAIQICQWLIDSNLAQTNQSSSLEKIEEFRSEQTRKKVLSKVDPIAIKIPLLNLDNFATQLNLWLGFLVSRWFAAIFVLFAMIGFGSLLFADTSQVQIFSRDNVFWMIGTWLLLKTIHEAAHILTCKSFGGEVGKGGILFLLLIPMPFVDVTSAWRFPSKLQRIVTSAAGMIAELFIASVAALIVVFTDHGPLNFHASNVLIAASLHTLLFNANPLMRFDGYHTLADWLEIPNLGNHGQNWLKGQCSRFFFGTEAPKLSHVGWRASAIHVYGVLAFLWRVLLCLILGIAAANQFYGVGLLVALIALVLWLALPCYRLARYLVKGTELEQPNRVQFVCATLLLTGVMFSAGKWIPVPGNVRAPAIVDYVDQSKINCLTDGFVEEVCVTEDQVVQENDILVRMSNPSLAVRRKQLTAQVEKYKLLTAQLVQQSRIAEASGKQGELEALREQIEDIDLQLENLIIRSPRSGVVLGSELTRLEGQLLTRGTQLFEVASPQQKELIALLSQADFKQLENSKIRAVKYRIEGEEAIREANLKKLLPRSTDSVPHFAFAAINGGPIDVVRRSEIEKSKEQDTELMFISPRLETRIELDQLASSRLYQGQPGIVYFKYLDRSLGEYLVSKTAYWIRKQITKSHGL